MERTDLEQCLADLRKKVVKGSKPTRQRRMRGYLKTLQGNRSSGRSQTALNPAPRVVRNKEDQPVAEETSMSLSNAVNRFRALGEGKTAKKPGDPGTDKAQSKINKAAWAKMSSEQKKKYTGDTPMPSHKEDLDEDTGPIDFDNVPVKSIATELAEEQSSHDERDLAFAKSMLLDREGLHESVRRQLLDEHVEQEEADPRGLPRGFAGDLAAFRNVGTRKPKVQTEADVRAGRRRLRGAFPGPQLPDEEQVLMRTGAFSGGDPVPAPGGREREQVDMRFEHEVDEAAEVEKANFDPTRIKYPKELIGR